MGVKLKGAQSVGISNIFEGGSTEEAEVEGWRCDGGRFFVTFFEG